MKRVLLVAAVLMTVSCGLEEVSRRPQNGAGEVWFGPGINVGKNDPEKKTVYVTAVEYPDGYDWRADVEKGSVKCSLVVYADDVPVMKVPAGDEYEVSPDPDMHRMSDGHLYTDYSTDSETVIKKDGKEIFRYSGREMICGLLTEGEDVYTLGHPRRGEGFTYRKNGDVIVERNGGRSFASLYRDGTSICFAFCEPILSQKDTLYRYYHVSDGNVSQTAVREDIRKVWDVISHEGEVCYLASVTGVSSPVLFRSGTMVALDMPQNSEMLACRLMAEDGHICVEGLYVRPGRSVTSGLWDEAGRSDLFDEGMTVSSICMNGDGVCCVLNGASSRLKGLIYRYGEVSDMPAGYASVGSDPAMVVDGIFHVGLSSLSGDRPMIWRDGRMTQLDINGFISTISVSGGQSSQDTVLD
ncbi:MAG: hypothetical protein IJN52_06635 [Bacteroidales bacterium]|nr:hypothetical protein [Bacteroidales bacterium]